MTRNTMIKSNFSPHKSRPFTFGICLLFLGAVSQADGTGAAGAKNAKNPGDEVSPANETEATSPTATKSADSLTKTETVLGASEYTWQLKRKGKGIRVYVRKSKDSPILQVRAIKKMKTNLSALVALIKDSGGKQRWIYRNKSATTLKKISDVEWINYKELEAPWPVSNRDMVVHSKLTQNPETFAIAIDVVGIPEYMPEQKGIVRIPKLITRWEFIPQGDGVVLVRFNLAIELGGNIPAWLVNTSIHRGPYETILGMSRFVKKRRYKKAALPYIIEPSEN